MNVSTLMRKRQRLFGQEKLVLDGHGLVLYVGTLEGDL